MDKFPLYLSEGRKNSIIWLVRSFDWNSIGGAITKFGNQKNYLTKDSICEHQLLLSTLNNLNTLKGLK